MSSKRLGTATHGPTRGLAPIHDLRFTEPRLAFGLLKYNEPPYYLWETNFDRDAAQCNGSVDAPFDDHPGEIDVPIFYVGAAGGFGVSGIYTTELTASRDVNTLVAQELPTDQRYVDYGHADLLTGKRPQLRARYFSAPLSMITFPSTLSVAADTGSASAKSLAFVPP